MDIAKDEVGAIVTVGEDLASVEDGHLGGALMRFRELGIEREVGGSTVLCYELRDASRWVVWGGRIVATNY